MLGSFVPRRVVAGLALALLLLMTVDVGSSPSSAAEEEHADPTAVAHDVLVLVDVTKSMVTDQGQGSVWAEVSASLSELVGRLAPGTNLAVVPFDAGPRLSLAYPQSDPQSEDRAIRPVVVDGEVVEEVQAHVATLPVDGGDTQIYESVEFALGQLARWRDETPDVTRVQTLVLYTDGEDTGPHGAEGAAGLAALVDRARQAGTPLAVVYHDVAGLVDEGDREVFDAAGVQVVSVEPASLVAIETPSIDLGRLDPGDPVTFELRLTSAFADVFGRRVEASLAGSEGVTLTSSSPALAPTMAFELSFTEGVAAGDHQVELVLSPVDRDFAVAANDRVIVQFEGPPPPPSPVGVSAAAPAPDSATSEVTEPQRPRDGAPLGLSASALLGMGAVLAVGLVHRHRRKASGTMFYRLLAGASTEPNSLLDPGARLIALTAEDVEQWGQRSEDDRRGVLDPHLRPLLQHLALTVHKGKLHVRPLDVPLLVDGERVPPEGRRLRGGELLRAGDLYARYDRCEVK